MERTDKLSERMGVSLRELGPAMDISPATLFACRKGTQPVSNKTWSKLERLEHSQTPPLIHEETEETIGRLVNAGPEGAAVNMSEEELCAALANWAEMLPKALAYMKPVILGNIVIFVNELNHRLNTRHIQPVRYGPPRKETL